MKNNGNNGFWACVRKPPKSRMVSEFLEIVDETWHRKIEIVKIDFIIVEVIKLVKRSRMIGSNKTIFASIKMKYLKEIIGKMADNRMDN